LKDEPLLDTLRRHWPEYLMEAAALGCFMISASVFASLLEYPGSPVRQALGDPVLRRVLMGLAMGLTAVAIIYSPWGKQSGAHMNPTRSFASTGAGWVWTTFWVYLSAPLLGMIIAAQLFAGLKGTSKVLCAKLHHENDEGCIFRCNYMRERSDGSKQSRRQEHPSLNRDRAILGIERRPEVAALIRTPSYAVGERACPRPRRLRGIPNSPSLGIPTPG